MMTEHPALAKLLLVTSLVAGLGCGGAKPAPAAQPTPSPTAARAPDDHGEMCPMRVRDTHVSATDTPDGAAMTFTTTGEVAQLRDRVRHMAAMHEHMMSDGAEASPKMGDGPPMMMVPSTARAEDIDGGARIVLVPKEPAQLAALRAQVHAHADHMASGHCAMMHHGG